METGMSSTVVTFIWPLQRNGPACRTAWSSGIAEPVGRVLDEDPTRRAIDGDLSLVHEDDAICDISGEPDLMGYNDHRHAIGGERLHNVEDLSHEFRIQ